MCLQGAPAHIVLLPFFPQHTFVQKLILLKRFIIHCFSLFFQLALLSSGPLPILLCLFPRPVFKALQNPSGFHHHWSH